MLQESKKDAKICWNGTVVGMGTFQNRTGLPYIYLVELPLLHFVEDIPTRRQTGGLVLCHLAGMAHDDDVHCGCSQRDTIALFKIYCSPYSAHIVSPLSAVKRWLNQLAVGNRGMKARLTLFRYGHPYPISRRFYASGYSEESRGRIRPAICFKISSCS
jgi:hypothetical protein